MKKIGIIKAISKKPEGKNAFTLQNEQYEGKDMWFNGYALSAEKGDEVEFELIINGDFNNFSELKVIRKFSDIAVPQKQPKEPNNSIVAQCLVKAVIAQKHENIVTIEDAVGMYETAVSKLNKQA